MGVLGFLTFTRHIARLSAKLCMGFWLLSSLPAMAQASSGFIETPILIAQRQTSLREGDRGPAVRELQQRLDGNGLFSPTIDGIYGPETTRAVRQFQQIRGLDVTGIADEDTLDDLGVDLDLLAVGLSHPAHGFISGDSIGPNSSLEDIRNLQRVLRTFGFDLEVDGVYGPATTQAVRAYEQTSGLTPVDGIADRETLLSMGFDSNVSDGRRRTSNRDDRRRRETSACDDIRRGSRSSYGRYVAAIIESHSELRSVRQYFPNATEARNNLGEYISIGRFVEPEDADDWADCASELGYEARVIRD